jgi:PhnB protein
VHINPYLTFDGTCQEAFTRYHDILGGTIEAMMRYGETPASVHVPSEWRDKIIHARLLIDGQMLMGSDAPPDRREPTKGMSVALQIESPAEAQRVFEALAEGGTINMPFEKTFWAERFGALVDRYGIPWMVNCPPKEA